MCKILFVAAEAAPFIKSGGLGDVIGSLPKALLKHGLDVRVILPLYSTIADKYKAVMTKEAVLTVPVGWRQQYCGVEKLKHNGVTYYFIDNQYYFNRDSLYGFYDDGERFAYFCQAVPQVLAAIRYQPDIIHCHDWHTGMVGFCLKHQFGNDPWYAKIKTVFTIHNLKYQGIFPVSIMNDLFSESDVEAIKNVEFDNFVNYLKAGLIYADKVTTVSKTYAQEIKLPAYGEKLDGILNMRSNDVIGIVNGIDHDTYKPQSDPNLYCKYNIRSLNRKQDNKIKLQEALGLQIDKEIPMFGIVSRLVEAKGLDLIACVIEDLLSAPIQLVVLGTGEKKYEDLFRYLASKYPDQVASIIKYDDILAHKIYAASDFYLMPSVVEPCGISQLIALKYGTVPIVRETGGLKDTINPFQVDTGIGNGFVFSEYRAEALLAAAHQALNCYHNKKAWRKLILNAMRCDYSWQASAKEYITLYEELLKH